MRSQINEVKVSSPPINLRKEPTKGVVGRFYRHNDGEVYIMSQNYDLVSLKDGSSYSGSRGGEGIGLGKGVREFFEQDIKDGSLITLEQGSFD